ncbi:unnamed protein product [Dracunculus medinensis]|uniref:3-beta hydroxysteroid dehydrogenase/isomerase domain-containing protein n=1 Tax=Dracunculus medinensis TaxID=318479 RepID=A0A3P7SAL2_DRAME|nr:unnamed protein product [Dracunculus medinensis]
MVTGATGYIGIHCVQQLLKQQYLVRGTVRNPDNEEKMKPLKSLEGSERLELMKADLDHDDYWNEVVQGCDYILHVASPFVINDDDSIIKTAVDGTLRVLRAAQQSSSVKKIVQTSSIVAINEKLFHKSNGRNFIDIHFKLTCINPVFVVGPALQEERGTSTMARVFWSANQNFIYLPSKISQLHSLIIFLNLQHLQIIKHFLDGRMPAYPAVQLALVDVRDVATAHIKAMCEPRTDGERILIASQSSLWFREIAKILRDEFGSQGLLYLFHIDYRLQIFCASNLSFSIYC